MLESVRRKLWNGVILGEGKDGEAGSSGRSNCQKRVLKNSLIIVVVVVVVVKRKFIKTIKAMLLDSEVQKQIINK